MKVHPRIYPANYPLLRELSAGHPAVRALQVHAEACDMCVGKEVNWPRSGIVGIDQTWFSKVDMREHRFSSFAYQYISYDLFLEGWVESTPEATKDELGFLEKVPEMRLLLGECEHAARADKNAELLPLIMKAREFVDTLEYAILFRMKNLNSIVPRPPLPYHPRIHPIHNSLLRELPADHPAVRSLQVHAEARDLCEAGPDQSWFSDLDMQEHRFSTFVDENISYDLDLDGWVESAPEATEAERGFLEDVPRMRTLLDECERAACAAKNIAIRPLLAKAREFMDATELAILYRLERLKGRMPSGAASTNGRGVPQDNGR